MIVTAMADDPMKMEYAKIVALYRDTFEVLWYGVDPTMPSRGLMPRKYEDPNTGAYQPWKDNLPRSTSIFDWGFTLKKNNPMKGHPVLRTITNIERDSRSAWDAQKADEVRQLYKTN